MFLRPMGGDSQIGLLPPNFCNSVVIITTLACRHVFGSIFLEFGVMVCNRGHILVAR
jgi:hypothetical protein